MNQRLGIERGLDEGRSKVGPIAQTVERPIRWDAPASDTWKMRKLTRTSKGRIGGVLFLLLLTGLLGGVAFAASSVNTARSTKTSPSERRSESPEAPEQDSGDQGGSLAHTPADCRAGLKDIKTSLPPADQATGLAHAIGVVESNCETDPQAPGLVVALGHLVTNYQRHLAHEADKAAGVHGNSADHGQSVTHGRSGQHGPSSQDGQD
jgi:hypothetical protein